VKDGILQTGTD